MKTLFALTALALAAVALPAGAQPRYNDSSFYVGGSLALSRTSSLSAATQQALTNAGYTATTTGGNRSTNLNLNAGYKFNPNVAAELSFDNVGTVNANSAITAPSVGTTNANWKSWGAGLSVLGILPVTDDFSVYGRVGVTQWRTSLGYSGMAVTTNGSSKATNTSATLGLGVSYALTQNLDVTGEVQRHNRVGNDSVGATGVTQGKLGLRLSTR